ncbi:MAG: hypothetical protein ACRDYV_10705 [Acidimicrobiia bacterium]
MIYYLANHEAGRQAQGLIFMLMAVVLFLAVVGVFVFLRRETRQRKKASGSTPKQG